MDLCWICIGLISIIILCCVLILNCPNSDKNRVESFSDVGGGIEDDSIPKVVYQTYPDKSKIPAKVFENIQKYAADYEHIIYNDEECLDFIKNNFDDRVVEAFSKLKKGAHKADLFRYCILYVNGGVYLDIKTVLLKPISEIFTKKYLYTALTHEADYGINKYIYQGIIASPPKNPIFLRLIDYIIENASNVQFYLQFVKNFRDVLVDEVGSPLKFGFNTTKSGIDCYLLEERVKYKECETRDRYNLCSGIYDGDENVIKTRYDDYPW